MASDSAVDIDPDEVDEDESIPLTEDIQNRPYQDELIELAMKENIICALGTGMGKTQIAVSVCKRMLHQITPAWDEGGQRTIMVVPAVPLVDQQARYFRRWLPVSVKGYHGGICVEWNKQTWEAEFRAVHILFMVPDILKELLHSALLDVSRINLLIFDECHHAGKSHSYREIMRYIEKRPLPERPRILGLTASVLRCKITDSHDLDALIVEREECLGAKVCTSVDESVGAYEAKPKISVEIFQRHSRSNKDTEICTELDEMIGWLDAAKQHVTNVEKHAVSQSHNVGFRGMSDEHFRLSIKKSLQLLKSSLNQMKETFDSLGPWCAYQVACMVKKDFELLIRNKCFHKELVNPAFSAISELHIFGSLLEIYYHTKKIQRGDITALIGVASPKLRTLLEVMRANKPTNSVNDPSKGLRCIIFVQSRFDVWALAKFFTFLSAGGYGEFSFIKSGYLVGQLLPTGNDAEKPYRVALSHQQSAAMLEKFRRGVVNVLIATNVVEEGLDVPDCNLIIRFDKPSNYCSYVQSKGRARALDSKYIVLSDAEESTKRELEEYERLDRSLKKLCVERCVPAVEQQVAHFLDKPDLHFSPPGSKAVASLNTALSFLQRYCNSLMPRLRFSVGSIHGKYIHEDPSGQGRYAYRIFMTLNSAIKQPVTGPFMSSRKLAKQAAALLCIEKLYTLEVLDENLLPVVETRQDDMFLMIGDRKVETTTEFEGAPGSKRRRQFYPKKMASLLSRCRPLPGVPCHLYLVQLEHTRTFHKDESARFIEDDSKCIGLLSRSPIPSFPSFSIYLCKSEYRVTLQLLDCSLRLTSQKVDDIQKAHCAIYEQGLLFIEAIAMHFDCNLDSEASYAVPLTKTENAERSYTIDWDMIDRIKDMAQYTVISLPEEVRQYRKVKPQNFIDGVVVRWYKPEEERFFVIGIRDDMNPTTQCKLDEYRSFTEYFEKKYGIQIQDLNQPIMDAKFCSRRLNVLQFVYHGIRPDETARDSRAETKRDGYLMLVPELCQLFPIPAPLYAKCLILPSLQHRLRWFAHMLFLYRLLKDETGIGIDTVEPDNWASLTFQGKVQQSIESADVRTREVSDQEMVVAVMNGEKVHSQEESVQPKEEEAEELPDEYGLVYAGFVRQKLYTLAQNKVPADDDENETTDVEMPLCSRDSSPLDEHFYDLSQEGCSHTLLQSPFLIDAEFTMDVKNAVIPDLSQLLNAVTSAKVADGFNLERLEVIGDTFLKFSSYVYVFFRFKQHQEGRLTQLCDQHVSNFNLYRLAKDKGLHSFALNQAFEPVDTFVPPGYVFDEKESNEILANSGTKADKFPSPRVHQGIEDKTVADVVEALIGTFLINSSARSAQLFMSWLGLHVLPEVNPTGERTVDKFGIFTAVDIPNPILRLDSDAMAELDRLSAGFEDFERRIGYKFRNKAFLLQAFTHATFAANSITDCYQRLEFLGDAIIDFLVTRYVYEDFKSHAPGVMSDLRSALVNNRTFSTLAVKYNYHNHIKFQNLHLHNAIDEFVQEIQESHQDVLPLEEEMLIAEFDDDKETSIDDIGFEEPEAPKALGDVFEAVAGAIYLDSGLSLDTVWRVYYNIMRPQIEYCMRNCPKNPVRELMEREGVNCRFGLGERLSNGKTLVQVTILGKGTFAGKGDNFRAAKCNASKYALTQIKR